MKQEALLLQGQARKSHPDVLGKPVGSFHRSGKMSDVTLDPECCAFA